MDKLEFSNLIAKELAPLIEAILSPSEEKSTARESLAASGGPCKILVKPSRVECYRLVLERSQAFEPHELNLAKHFLRILSEVIALEKPQFQGDLLQTIPRRLVSETLEGGDALRTILEGLETWASRTYEGQRITACFGIGNSDEKTDLTLGEYWTQDFAPVISNGFDTLVEVTRQCYVSSISHIDSSEIPDFSPYRLNRVANWSAGGRIAVALNRNGEILVFKDVKLRFIRRDGKWSHYSHDANIRRLSPPKDTVLRKAIYSSCLDVSSARSGGCLGVIDREQMALFEDMVSENDRIKLQKSFKTKLISKSFTKPFQELDRRIRQELLGIDGALILDYQGNILAVGAIIQVEAGSVGGGGRLAAAKRLSEAGLGIKVSEDGSIVGYRKKVEVFRA